MTDFILQSNGRDCKHGQLARKCLICEMEAEIATLTRERDEARGLAVWAVRWNADTDSASTGERWLIWGHDERNRIRVDGTDADILRALKEAKGNGDQ